MVAIGAVMHKVCNIVFAVLRDEKAFELRSPEEHCKQYQRDVYKRQVLLCFVSNSLF